MALCSGLDGGQPLSSLQLQAAVAAYLEGDGAGGGVVPNVAALASSLVRLAAHGGSRQERRSGADAVAHFHEWLPAAALVREVRKVLALEPAPHRGGGDGDDDRGGHGRPCVRALQLLARLPPRPVESVNWAAVLDDQLVLRLSPPGVDAGPFAPLPATVVDWCASTLPCLGGCPALHARLRWLVRRPALSAQSAEHQERWRRSLLLRGEGGKAGEGGAGAEAAPAVPPEGGEAVGEADAERWVDPEAARLPLRTWVLWELCAAGAGSVDPALDCYTTHALSRDYLGSSAGRAGRAALAGQVVSFVAQLLALEPALAGLASPAVAAARLLRACAEIAPSAAEEGAARALGGASSEGEARSWLARALAAAADAITELRSAGGAGGEAACEVDRAASALLFCMRSLPEAAASDGASRGHLARGWRPLLCRPLFLTGRARLPERRHGRAAAPRDAVLMLRRRPLLAELLLRLAPRATVSRSPPTTASSGDSIDFAGGLVDGMDAGQHAALQAALDAVRFHLEARLAAVPWLAASVEQFARELRCASADAVASAPPPASPAAAPPQPTIDASWRKRKKAPEGGRLASPDAVGGERAGVAEPSVFASSAKVC